MLFLSILVSAYSRFSHKSEDLWAVMKLIPSPWPLKFLPFWPFCDLITSSWFAQIRSIVWLANFQNKRIRVSAGIANKYIYYSLQGKKHFWPGSSGREFIKSSIFEDTPGTLSKSEVNTLFSIDLASVIWSRRRETQYPKACMTHFTGFHIRAWRLHPWISFHPVGA